MVASVNAVGANNTIQKAMSPLIVEALNDVALGKSHNPL